ncbi:hypothetical protein K8I28_12045 [bacterium]|nr:hypothetical protein [bacterium]
MVFLIGTSSILLLLAIMAISFAISRMHKRGGSVAPRSLWQFVFEDRPSHHEVEEVDEDEMKRIEEEENQKYGSAGNE